MLWVKSSVAYSNENVNSNKNEGKRNQESVKESILLHSIRIDFEMFDTQLLEQLVGSQFFRIFGISFSMRIRIYLFGLNEFHFKVVRRIVRLIFLVNISIFGLLGTVFACFLDDTKRIYRFVIRIVVSIDAEKFLLIH